MPHLCPHLQLPSVGVSELTRTTQGDTRGGLDSWQRCKPSNTRALLGHMLREVGCHRSWDVIDTGGIHYTLKCSSSYATAVVAGGAGHTHNMERLATSTTWGYWPHP